MAILHLETMATQPSDSAITYQSNILAFLNKTKTTKLLKIIIKKEIAKKYIKYRFNNISKEKVGVVSIVTFNDVLYHECS